MSLRISGVLVLCLLLAGCVSYLVSNHLTEQRDSGLLFSHATHAEEAECLDCHETALTQWKAGMPDADSCQECHEEGDHSAEESDACTLCHTKPIGEIHREKPSAYEDIKFNHAKHAKSAEDCATCHGAVKETESLSDIAFPSKHKGCVKCHKEDVKKDCSLCHTRTAKDIKPENHNHAWIKVHGEDVMDDFLDRDWYTCKNCHEESYCNSCHRIEAPRNHNQPWRQRSHGLAAEVDRMKCSVCHEEHFCIRCHKHSTPRSHRGSWGDPQNRHCNYCHTPLESTSCFTCHKTSPSHGVR